MAETPGPEALAAPPGAPPDSRFALVDGERVEFRHIDRGRPGAPTLVFLHQGLGSVSTWRDVPDRLAALTGCDALLYSRRGYGWSEPLKRPRDDDYMLLEASRTLPAVLQAFGLDDVVLIGHSDGGTIALIYLGLGHRARAAIAVAPHVRDETLTHETIAVQRGQWGVAPLRGKLQRYHRDADAMFLSWTDIWLSAAFRGWSMEHLLPAVKVPVLGLQGWQDDSGSMVHIDTVQRLATGPVELEKLDGCGHDPFRSVPDRTLQACAGFLRRHALLP